MYTFSFFQQVNMDLVEVALIDDYGLRFPYKHSLVDEPHCHSITIPFQFPSIKGNVNEGKVAFRAFNQTCNCKCTRFRFFTQ